MHIDHIAMWTHQLEMLKYFYEKYFSAKSGDKYHNQRTHFESYFLSFPSGARLELMSKPGVSEELAVRTQQRSAMRISPSSGGVNLARMN